MKLTTMMTLMIFVTKSSADKIQDAGEVTVEMNMKGEMFGEKYDESEEEEVVVVKIGGKWYIHDMSGAF